MHRCAETRVVLVAAAEEVGDFFLHSTLVPDGAAQALLSNTGTLFLPMLLQELFALVKRVR